MRFSVTIIIGLCLCRASFPAKTTREIIPQKSEDCEKNAPMQMKITPLKGTDTVSFTGYISIKENITGDLTMIVEANRCDFDMKNCINYQTVKISDICGVLNSKTSMFAAALKTIQPPLRCPLRAGNYTLVDTVVDLSIFSMIPIDGSIWVASFKMTGGSAKNRKALMCWITETKIVKRNKQKP